jgi:AcrR family transcriptional regulator
MKRTPDTKTRILDAAERLFAARGYAATSLRHVIAEAQVNLAAVHYHFGSKEELLSAVVRRKIGPVNDERLRMLDAAERRARPRLDDVLRAFFEPAFRALADDPEIAHLMGRLYGAGDLLPKLMGRNFGVTIGRFRQTLARALPRLAADELAWRVHFAIGAMAHTLRVSPAALGAGPHRDPPTACAHLVRFVGAALRAPSLKREKSK